MIASIGLDRIEQIHSNLTNKYFGNNDDELNILTWDIHTELKSALKRLDLINEEEIYDQVDLLKAKAKTHIDRQTIKIVLEKTRVLAEV